MLTLYCSFCHIRGLFPWLLWGLSSIGFGFLGKTFQFAPSNTMGTNVGWNISSLEFILLFIKCVTNLSYPLFVLWERLVTIGKLGVIGFKEEMPQQVTVKVGGNTSTFATWAHVQCTTHATTQSNGHYPSPNEHPSSWSSSFPTFKHLHVEIWKPSCLYWFKSLMSILFGAISHAPHHVLFLQFNNKSITFFGVSPISKSLTLPLDPCLTFSKCVK